MIGPRLELDGYPGFRPHSALNQRMQRNRLQCGRGQLRKLPVGLDEAIERFCAVLNDLETTFEAEHILLGTRCLHTSHFQWIDMDPRTKAAGNGFDGRERIVDFVANHPDEPLPCIALLLAQGNADVREHQQRVRDAALAKTGSSYHPVDGIAFAGKNHDALIGLVEHRGKLQLIGAAAQGPRRGEMEDALRGGIDKPQAMGRIKGKHRRVHGRNDAAQQCRGLQLTQTLALQHVGEFIDLQGKLSQSIQLPPPARAKGVVGFAQRGDNVGQGLKRADDLLHEHACCNQGKQSDDTQKSCGCIRRNVCLPQQDRGEYKRGRCNEQTQDTDTALEWSGAVGAFLRAWLGAWS